MANLEEELMYVGVTNETNQLVLSGISGEITAEFEQSLKKELDINLKLEPQEPKDSTGTEPKKPKPGKKGSQKLKPFQCPECVRKFLDNDRLIGHIRRTHRGEHAYQCTMCQYSTHHKAVFDEHVRVHSGIKPFKCSQCDYRSASKKNAKKHENTQHSRDPTLLCTECNKYFANTTALKKHLQTKHTSHRQCKHCSGTFEYPNQLRYHQQTYVKKCSKCPVKVCSKDAMVKHMAEEHNEYYYHEQNDAKKKKSLWECKICHWKSHSHQKTLLHLIHHPNQEIDVDLDITPLKKFNIL